VNGGTVTLPQIDLGSKPCNLETRTVNV